MIDRRCPLCKNYSFCAECPFRKFKMKSPLAGCEVWMTWLIKPSVMNIWAENIWWHDEYDKKARKELKLLKKKARELIKWV